MKLTWKKEPGMPGIQAPISHGGKKHDYVISHRRDEHTVSFRPPGKHEHVGTFATEKAAKAAAAVHARQLSAAPSRHHSTVAASIDTTETLTRKFQRRQRDALTLGEMARQARGAATRWERRATAYASAGEHREANEADAEARSLWAVAADLDQEVQVLRSPRHHSTIKPVQSCSVAKYLEVLSHELVRYDVATSARETKRRIHVNIYRLGHYMGALQRVREEVGSRTSDSEADKAGFRMAMYGNFERDFPPVKKVVKQLEAGTCKIK
jgi:hypothetical protein